MRYYLTRLIIKCRYVLRPARSLGLLVLLFISLSVHAGGSVTDYAKFKDTVNLPDKVSRDEFKKKALAKIKEFQGCLYILCDKNSGRTAQDNAVDQATALFVDGAIIEVSSIHSNEKKHLRVRDFLEKLRNLHYERIVITFSHVDYVSHIRKGADGKYYGLVSFEQTFRA